MINYSLKFLLVTFISFSFYGSVFAQAPKNFTHEPVKFIEEMKLFIQATNKKEGEKLMERFLIAWNKFDSNQKEKIYSTSDAMLKKRLKAIPDFSNYLNALIGFTESSQSVQSFDNWHAGIGKLLTGSARNFSNYLEVCYDLFASNTLYSSGSILWKSNNNNYSFEFDSLPKIVFPSFNLSSYAKGDSSTIFSTGGAYYPNLKKFYGKGGTVYWIRAGLPKGEVYAELKKYVIDLTGSDYVADSVVFYNKQIFKEALTGRLTERILAATEEEKVSYPRFRSYNTNLEIKELVKDASYRGGFSMHGGKIIGSGDRRQDARLTFHKDGKPFLVASSQSFVIRPDRIVSDIASVTFRLDKDSIYHPGVELKYIGKERELSLLRQSGKSSGTPFYDSYHDVDMYFDAMVWKIDDPLIDLKMISGEGEVKLTFESSNYFRSQRYQSLQGFTEVNPLYTLREYADRYQTRVVSVSDYAAHLRMSESQVRSHFLSLNSKGFVAYDEGTDKAVIKDRLYYYISASVGKTDYDILEFQSQISGKPNATINLLNYDITIRGVARVALSDTQNVYVIPHEQEVVLKKNRDFTFAGRVKAGRFDFYGKEFGFVYDDFKINLKAVDSLSVKIPGDTVLPDGRRPLYPIKSVLQDVTGDLNIDRPDNKSSYQKSPEYPLFKSDKQSYVYYDYPWIYNGVYKKDAFYFKVDPFAIDSLDNFEPEGLFFDGSLVSAGIFPDMPERLKIQEDFSLGFKKSLDDAGVPAYAGKGTYYDKLNLSNKGLKGSGKIEYLSSVSWSKEIFFFPDSANADVDKFDMTRRVIASSEYPEVHGKDVYINWRPKEDKMFVFKKANNFDMYANNTVLDGNLVLAKTGLTGNGLLTFDQAQVISNKFDLKQITFVADTSDFSLKSLQEDIFALATTNMKSFIDFEKRYGEFTSNGEGSYVTFPLNQYICYIEKFKWMMDDKNVQFDMMAYDKNITNMNLAGSEFISINPEQDSLRWFSPNASYSLADYLIKAREVKEINVADASVIPGDGNVIVEQKALMRPLKDARVIANTTTRYHTMTEAEINIRSRKNYSGNGYYEYVDQLGQKHLLRLTQIGVDTSYQTFANGEIPDTMNFLLSPNIQYKGNLSIQASRPNPFFRGFARANHGCESLKENWFGFASEIDPKGVNVPVKAPISDNNEKLFSGIMFAKDSANAYGTFLMAKNSASDQEIISAEGLLSYDNSSREFRITPVPEDPDKKPGKDEPEKPFNHGNTFVLNNESCAFRGEGNIYLGANFGQFRIKTIGDAFYEPAVDTLFFDVMSGLEFFFNEDALREMAELILSFPTLPPTNDNRPVFQNGMQLVMGREKADKFISELSLYGTPKKVPEELQNGIFITEMKMYWHKESLSFKSKGKLGIGYVGKTAVNRQLNGYYEVARKRSGDIFNLFIEIDGNTWIYFNYQRGVMQAISSDQKFNDIINNMKPDKRVADEKDGKPPYQYLLSTDRKKNEFIKRFEYRPE